MGEKNCDDNKNLDIFYDFATNVINGDESNFWSAIKVLISTPHYLYRKILFSKCVISGKINKEKYSIDDIIQNLTTFKEYHAFLEQLKCMLHQEVSIDEVFEKLIQKKVSADYFLLCNENTLKNDDTSRSYGIFLLDSTKSCVYSFSYYVEETHLKLTHPMPYVICYLNYSISIKLFNSESQNHKYLNWIENKLMKKIISWSELRENSKNSPIQCKSLSLVNIEIYGKLYSQLKTKYGKSMCEMWPDNTDPLKYVYEDIAIATYLLLIWAQDREYKKCDKKQRFVDLGCGNGLLVHILNSEGYSGYGLDIRKRSLWDKYPLSTILKEIPFIPTTDTFSDIDWLIGNHSDEITPWLPITATRSSMKTNYFVIPCCPYELNGNKYQRKSSNNTVYEDFIYYVQKISNICGFETQVDRLRIPSTKRTCLIGWKRRLSLNEYEKLCETVKVYVEQECSLKIDYKIRDKEEKVQNCTKINKSIQNDIVKIIVNKLLDIKNIKDGWNAGCNLNIKDLAQLIPKHLLTKLKSECGGLQTLLKNQNIFNIKNGIVSLSRPKSIKEMKEFYVVHRSSDNKISLKKKTEQINYKNAKYIKCDEIEFDKLLQKKDCWYFFNHPQGCPLSNEECSFKHV